MTSLLSYDQSHCLLFRGMRGAHTPQTRKALRRFPKPFAGTNAGLVSLTMTCLPIYFLGLRCESHMPRAAPLPEIPPRLFYNSSALPPLLQVCAISVSPLPHCRGS